MRRFAFLLLVVSLALAGCGGGGESGKKKTTPTGESAVQASPSSGGAAPPTGAKARYIARVDAICRRANKRLAPLRTKLAKVDAPGRSKGQVFTQFHDLTDRAATISDGILGQVEGVSPPANDQAAIARIRALLERQSQLLHGLAAAAGRRDAGAIKQLNGQITSVSQAYRARAQAYGFRVCGQGG